MLVRSQMEKLFPEDDRPRLPRILVPKDTVFLGESCLLGDLFSTKTREIGHFKFQTQQFGFFCEMACRSVQKLIPLRLNTIGSLCS